MQRDLSMHATVHPTYTIGKGGGGGILDPCRGG